LAVGTTWNLASATPSALQLPVVIHDFSRTVVIVVERGPAPLAITSLAFGAKRITPYTDVAAGLAIRTARRAPSTPVTIPVATSVSVAVAPELPIDIADAASAPAVGIERSVHPRPIAILATGAQRVVLDADVAASLGVVAGRNRTAAALAAGKLATGIADISTAPAIVRQ